LAAVPGSPASFSAARVARENGFSLGEHSARPLVPELVEQADLILVMEPDHRRQLLSQYPEASEKVLLLRRFARYGSRDRAILDPYGLNLEAYRFCFQDVKECVESLHAWLLGNVGPRR
jgi:protein-tyrosine phosphatase